MCDKASTSLPHANTVNATVALHTAPLKQLFRARKNVRLKENIRTGLIISITFYRTRGVKMLTSSVPERNSDTICCSFRLLLFAFELNNKNPQ